MAIEDIAGILIFISEDLHQMLAFRDLLALKGRVRLWLSATRRIHTSEGKTRLVVNAVPVYFLQFLQWQHDVLEI